MEPKVGIERGLDLIRYFHIFKLLVCPFYVFFQALGKAEISPDFIHILWILKGKWFGYALTIHVLVNLHNFTEALFFSATYESIIN